MKGKKAKKAGRRRTIESVHRATMNLIKVQRGLIDAQHMNTGKLNEALALLRELKAAR